MRIKNWFPVWGMNINYCLLFAWLLHILIAISAVPYPPHTAILLNANPVNVKRLSYHPFRVVKRKSPPFYDDPSRSDDYYYDDGLEFPESDSFAFEAGDAVSNPKYSPPIIENRPTLHAATIPLSYPSRHETFAPTFYSTTTGQRKSTIEYPHYVKSSTTQPLTKGYKHFDPRTERDASVLVATVTSDYKVDGGISPLLSDQPTKDQKQPTNVFVRSQVPRKNFTETNDSQISEPSDTVLQYESPAGYGNESNNDERHLNNRHLQNRSQSISTTVLPKIESETLLKDNRQVPTYVGTDLSNISVQFPTTRVVIDFIENNTWTTPDSFDVKGNISDILTPTPIGNTKSDKLSSGAFAGIIIAILSGVTILTSSVIYLLYKRYNGKCTSVVDGKFNSDNCGYLDDSLRSSVYLNNHIELPKENSEEMTSLDNDSFLNSLETMTIQNYWADSTKNTKV